MALNWAMLNSNRSPIPLPGEITITTVDLGVDVMLIIPDRPPTSSSATAGGFGGARRLKGAGKLWLTDQRLIYTTDIGSPFDSLSVPLHSILSTGFHQPTFGSNYLTFEVKPSEDGGLTDGTNVEVRFRDRAMFEFVSLLEKTREKAIYMKRQALEDEVEGLPLYTMPVESSSVSMVGGIPVENPPGYDV